MINMRRISFNPYTVEEGCYYYIKEKMHDKDQHLVKFIKIIPDRKRKILMYKLRLILSTRPFKNKFATLDFNYQKKGAFEFYRLRNKEEGFVYFL